MRLLLCVLLSLALLVAYLMEDEACVTSWREQVIGVVTPLLYERELRIVGAMVLSRKQIESMLPFAYSNVWWRTHLEQVPQELLKSPLVSAAEVRPCAAVSVRCFELKMEERKPAFIAVMSDASKSWLVGQDGGFIAPLTYKQFQDGVLKVLGEDGKNLIVVRGLWDGQAAPDEVKARLSRLAEALKSLQLSSGFIIREVVLQDGTDIKVRFDNVSFPVVFELSAESLPELPQKGSQLKRVVLELGDSQAKVKEVDFALKKMAVVRY